MDKGAHFRRCDFQVHSPRDRNWTGPDCITDADRRQYARSLIRACRSTNLDAIAITDHHDLLFVRYVREAAQAEKDSEGKAIPSERQIVVFPGIELTLNVPCQAIVIFDALLPDDMFSLALTALSISPTKPEDAKTVETKRLDHIATLTDLRAELEKREFLRNRYIILPNVSEGGHDTLMRKGNAPKYTNMPCVGGYLDGSYEKCGTGNRGIFEGKNGEWGNKRIALFQTSDSRSATHEHLGEHSTWVKWAVPTAEAIRQACLAQESRISQASPVLPGVAITGLSVSNSVFLGPINLDFNGQYNALIGGRGTGKSTVLEYLRWALCDQLPAIGDDEDLPNYQLRRKSLIELTLQPVKGSVRVSFTVNGIQHVVMRQSDTGNVSLKVGNGEFEPCSEAEVRMLLPIQAYSQKQLSNVSVRLEELSRFVEAPIRNDLDGIERRFEATAAELRQVYATSLRKRRLMRQLDNESLSLTSLIEQAGNLRKSLKGLTKDDIALLEAKPQYDKAEEVLEEMLTKVARIDDAVTEVVALAKELPAKPRKFEELPEQGLLVAIDEQIRGSVTAFGKLVQQLAKERDKLIATTGEYKGELGKLLEQWETKAKAFSEKYEAAKGRASAHEAQLKRLTLLEGRAKELRSTLAGLRREIGALGDPDKRTNALRKIWRELHEQRTKLINAECVTLTARAQGEIRASVQAGGRTDLLLDHLRTATTGSGVRREKMENLANMIAKDAEPLQMWQAFLTELEQLALLDPKEDAGSTLPTCPLLSGCGITSGELLKLAARLTPEAWLELSLVRLQERPLFEYRVRQSEYIPFRNASAGQQATSLLKALLNQPGPPLIIDQPEEDLDNPVILEVVEQIWRAKKERQLVFASHNANLVVNGDAELVVWCDYRVAGDHSRGHIRGEGAIDMPAICTAVKQVMEGGEAAFKLRRDKYGF